MIIKETEFSQTKNMVDEILEEHGNQFDRGITGITEYCAFTAYDGEQVLGGIVGRKTEDLIHIQGLALSPESRGKGIGTQLIEKLIDHATKLDCTTITLSTMDFQARGFYEKMGFEVFGELSDVPKKGTTKYFVCKRIA